eukprot:365336-Chlamydomonas_euryale.AAC.10
MAAGGQLSTCEEMRAQREVDEAGENRDGTEGYWGMGVPPTQRMWLCWDPWHEGVAVCRDQATTAPCTHSRRHCGYGSAHQYGQSKPVHSSPTPTLIRKKSTAL